MIVKGRRVRCFRNEEALETALKWMPAAPAAGDARFYNPQDLRHSDRLTCVFTIGLFGLARNISSWDLWPGATSF
jgi:hypothetical protein